MRVCFYTISPKRSGGVVRKATLLARFLVEAGHEVTWYAPRWRGEFPPFFVETLDSSGFEFHEIGRHSRFRPVQAIDLFGEIPTSFDVYQVISGFCADGAVFASKGVPFFCWAASTIRSEKGDSAKPQLSGAKRLVSESSHYIMRIMERRYGPRATAVFANSSFTRGRLAADIGLDFSRIRVLHPPVDIQRFSPTADGARVPGTVLFVGIVSPRKNIYLLLNALARLARRRPEVRLKLVGRLGPFSGWCEKECRRLGISDRVELLGEVQDVVPHFRGATVTVLPSHQEGFGMVLAESLACGTPVIATDCGGVRDIVDPGANGLLVTPNDVGALTQAIEKVISNPRRAAEMGQSGRAKIVREFAADVVGRKLLAIYAEHGVVLS